MKIKEIKIEEEKYPEGLRRIQDSPRKLYVLGNYEILKEKAFAIVGSRDCTENGRKNAKLFAANLASAGFVIVSGMAKGIDSAAHMGVLKVKGKTIAVLGNGPKYIYPPENKEIYQKILAEGGAIISEYPEDTPPDSDKFRKRNRIVSGLSMGILIVEAAYRSGTSITARYAKEQGKEVYCIPNAIENKKGKRKQYSNPKRGKASIKPRRNCRTISREIRKTNYT